MISTVWRLCIATIGTPSGGIPSAEVGDVNVNHIRIVMCLPGYRVVSLSPLSKTSVKFESLSRYPNRLDTTIPINNEV